ncbi:MAG: xanthine and Co dehydrogenase maturation factor [Chloroflexota bacterium]|nr:MAG: xanthine and Co dehydrogenase maturation factor [Chloroflexota bacterium]
MSLLPQLKEYLQKDQSVTLAVVVRGPAELLGVKALVPAEGEPAGPLLETPWGESIRRDAQQLMAERTSATRRYPPLAAGGEEIEVFFDVHRPAPRLIIVGGVHIASDLIHFAKPLGFSTYLVDPRTAFASPERFPHADHLIQRWPDEALPEIGLTRESSVVVVTHDPKLDDPALLVALPSPAGYVGALGSPKTHAQRVKRLLESGLTQAQIDRLHAPIGLDLGGRTPAEIALSIMAEIVAVRNGMAGSKVTL